MKYAGFWRRFAAGLIDCLIVGIFPSMMFQDNGALSFIVGLGYSIWMLGMYGATVGMDRVGINILYFRQW